MYCYNNPIDDIIWVDARNLCVALGLALSLTRKAIPKWFQRDRLPVPGGTALTDHSLLALSEARPEAAKSALK